MSSIEKYLRWAELKDGGAEVTHLKNIDIKPVPVERRIWNMWDYCSFFAVGNVAMGTWSAASSLLSLGLGVGETMGVIVVGNIFVSTFYLLIAAPGYDWHIGYTIFQRAIFGVRGFYVTVILRILLAIVGYASHCWTGGLLVTSILETFSHSWLMRTTHFPKSVPMADKDLIGFILFQLINIPFFFHRPEQTNTLLHVGTTMCFFSFVGLVAWAVAANGGSNGPLMHVDTKLSSYAHGWAWMYGITSWYGSITTGIMNCADYTRFTKKTRTSWFGMYFGNFLMGTIIPLTGVVTTSALKGVYGVEYWLPPKIFTRVLTENYSSKARAGVFFCAFGILACHVALNVTGNAVCGGTDMAGLLPKYISIRRGCFIILALSWACCPWTFYNTSSSFLTVITSFSVFICPALGIYIAEYFIKRKRNIKLTDLYSYNKNGVYYFSKGVHWPNLVAWVIGCFPGIPGLAAAANENIHIGEGWANFYNGCVFFGCLISMFLCILFNYIWPDTGLTDIDPEDYFDTFTEAEAVHKGIIPYQGTIVEGINVDPEKISHSADEKLDPVKSKALSAVRSTADSGFVGRSF